MQNYENERSQKNESEKYSGCWIPRSILSSKILSNSEKLLLSQVYNLDNETGCTATNAYLADSLGWTVKTTERVLAGLRKNGFISIVSMTPKRRMYITAKVNTLKNEDIKPLVEYPQKWGDNTLKNGGIIPSKMGDNTLKSEDHIIQDNTLIEQDKTETDFLNPSDPVDFKSEPEPAILVLTPPVEKKKSKKTTALAKVDDPPQFTACWNAYEKYGSKKKALGYWEKLSQADRDAIEAKIPDYIASTPGCKFRKMFDGWINPENELWKRPIIQNRNEERFSVQARNQNIKRDLEAIQNNPDAIHVSSFERDQALLKKLFDY